MVFNTAWDYINKYNDLENGYYEYFVNGEFHHLLTIWCPDTGPWIRVVEVDWNNNNHCTQESVKDIKPHDDIIRGLITDQDYNARATVDVFKSPFNKWIRYPHNQYMHINNWHSENVVQQTNNNLISLDYTDKPHLINVEWCPDVINFGITQGDQYFGYGQQSRFGFVQDFSGAGKGSVYVR